MTNKRKKYTLLLMSLWACVCLYGYDLELDGIYYKVDVSKRTATIVKYPSAAGNVVIPDGVDYNTQHLKVAGIEDSAFEGNKNITSISCQEPKSIGKSSFKNCSNLVSVQIPIMTNGLIPEYAFYACTNLKYINNFVDDYSKIETFAFYGCKSIKRFTIPSTVSHIENGAFYEFCAERLTIEDSESELLISDLWVGQIFSADTICWNRSNIHFYLGRGNIRVNVFVLGESVKEISKVVSVSQKVISPFQDPVPITISFSTYTYMNATLCVPQGSLEKYQNTNGWWSKFFVIKEENFVCGIGQVRAESSNRPLYNIEGVKVGRTNKGLNIVRCSDGKLRKVMMTK